MEAIVLSTLYIFSHFIFTTPYEIRIVVIFILQWRHCCSKKLSKLSISSRAYTLHYQIIPNVLSTRTTLKNSSHVCVCAHSHNINTYRHTHTHISILHHVWEQNFIVILQNTLVIIFPAPHFTTMDLSSLRMSWPSKLRSIVKLL